MPCPARALLFFAVAAALLPPAARADPLEPAAVIAVQVAGKVGGAYAKAAPLQEVEENAALAAGDYVETGPQSTVVLVLPNGTTVYLGKNTRLALTRVRQTPLHAPDLVVFDPRKPEPSTSSTALELVLGELIVQTRTPVAGSDFSIKTPVGSAGAHGAEFALTYAEDENGEAECSLGTARGTATFTPLTGSPVEVGSGRRLEVRARVAKAGARPPYLQTHVLPDGDRERIRRQNEAAREDVNQVLMRARAMHGAPKPLADTLARPAPPAPPENTAKAKRPEPPAKPARPVRPGGD